MQATNEPMRFVLPADLLQKARTTKYKRRWRGKDGKWQYEYETPQQEREHKAHLAAKDFKEMLAEHAAKITERYDDAHARQRLDEIGSGLYETQVASRTPSGAYERDGAGFSLFDMQKWQNIEGIYSATERLKQMRLLIAQYKKQLGAEEPGEHFEEYVKLGLYDALRAAKEGDPPRLKPEANRYGGVNLPLTGDRLKGAKWDQYRDTMRKYKQHGLRFDGADRAWYVRNVDLESFPWAQMQADLESFGVGMEEVPKIEKKAPKEEKHAGPVAPGTDTDTVIEAIQRRRVDDTVAVTVIKEGEHKGKYAFYSTFSRDWNDIFSNKSGVLTGITEYVPELGHARVTDDRHLVDEALARVAERMPNHTVIVGPEVKAKQDAEAEALSEAQKAIPDVTQHLAQGVDLFPFQNAGTRFLMETDGNALIGDEMGLGKTMQTLAYAAAKGKKVLVVCPRVVRKNWLREGTRFFPDYFKGRELKSADLRKTGQPDLSGDNLVTVNYESLHKFLPAIEAAGFDTIVIDESHRMKNPKAKITQTLKALAPKMKHKILLSGTAIKNKKVELYEQIELIKPGMFRSANELKMATTGGVWHKLQSVYMARRKKDVLKDLPPKISSIVRMDVPLGELPDTPKDIGEISRAKADLAVAKTGATAEFVKEILASSDSNVLVFSDSKEAANELKAKLGDVAVLHTGDTSEKAREVAVGHFDPSTRKPGDPVRVFVATTQSAGIGINLQTADKVVFNDLPWTPADLRQAEDRAYRIGTESAVNVYWNTVEGHEFDELIADTIKRKYELSKKVLEGKQLTAEERKWMDEGISKADMLAALKGEKPSGPPGTDVPTESTKTQAEPVVTVPSQAQAPAAKPERPKMVIKPAALPQKAPKPPPQTYAEQKAEAEKKVPIAPTKEQQVELARDHVDSKVVPDSLRGYMDTLHRYESQGQDPRTPFVARGTADKLEIWFRASVGRTVEGGKVEAVGKNAWRWRGGGEEITLTRDPADPMKSELTYTSKAPDPGPPGGEGPPPDGDKLSDHAAKVEAYNAKLEAKRDRLRERAEKAKRESAARYKASDMSEEATGIPMGQPILVGHHSEKRHRKTVERAHANMGRSIELDRKAAELERRAEKVGASGISSDDPEAVTKIKEKLATKEKARDTMKALNKAYKKHGQDWAAIQEATGVSDKTMAALKRGVETMPHYEKAPFPGYALTNLGAEIRRLKGRIEELQAAATRPTAAPITGEGFRIEEHPDDNRIRFYFDEKPAKEVTRKMRSAGFKWSPTEGAWQRHLNEAGRYHAERVAKEIFGEGAGQAAEAPQAPPETPPEPEPIPPPEMVPEAVPEPEEGAHAPVEPKPEPKPEQTATPAPDAHAGMRKPARATRRQAKLEAAGQLSLFKSRIPVFVLRKGGLQWCLEKVDRLIKAHELDEAMDLIKAAGHKYLRRIPIPGGGKRKWRYVYSEASGRAAGGEHAVGEKLRLTSEGQIGHYEVEHVFSNGFVTVRHDESGAYLTLHRDTLRDWFKVDHKANVDATHQRLEKTLRAARQFGTEAQQKRAQSALLAFQEAWQVEPTKQQPKAVIREFGPLARSEMDAKVEELLTHDDATIEGIAADLDGRIKALEKSPRGVPLDLLRWKSVVSLAQQQRKESKEPGAPAVEPTPEVKETPAPETLPDPKPVEGVSAEATAEVSAPKPRAERKPKEPEAGKLEAVGDHIYGSIKDLRREGKITSVEDINNLSYRDAASIVKKQNVVPVPDIGTLKGLGMEPAAAHLSLGLLASIKAKPGDTDAARRAYITESRHVYESLLNCKTLEDVRELCTEMWRAQRASPSHVLADNPMITDRNDDTAYYGIKAEVARLKKVNPGIEYSIRMVDENGEWGRHKARTHVAILREVLQPYEALGQNFDRMMRNDGKAARAVHMAAHAIQKGQKQGEDGWRLLEAAGTMEQRKKEAKKKERSEKKDATGKFEGGKTFRGWSEVLQIRGEALREGGKEIPKEASADRTRETFNLREVDYGTEGYMKQGDREYHTRALEAGLHDLSDMLGVAPHVISFKGRLGVALGARGKGTAGWKKQAAKAHYETGKFAINITKFRGGGSLAHEWAHALDNLIVETNVKQQTGAAYGEYATHIPEHDNLPPEVRSAVKGVVDALMKSPNPEAQRAKYNRSLTKVEGELENAVAEYRAATKERQKLEHKPQTEEKRQAKIEWATQQIADYEKQLEYWRGKKGKKAEQEIRNREYWMQNARARLERNSAPDALRTEADQKRINELANKQAELSWNIEHYYQPRAECLRSMPSDSSDYAIDAAALGKEYWALPTEMMARAFASYIEDKLVGQGRRNTYLVDGTDKKYLTFVSARPELEHAQPFPQGAERRHIHAALEKLLATMKEGGHLLKSLRTVPNARFMLRK